MIVSLLLLAILIMWGIRFPGYHANYMGQTYTTAIKGIFTVLIFYSHIRGYITLSPAWWNTSYNTILDHLGQLIVVLFFFYSGYGIWESRKRKPGYGSSFFKRRFLKVLLHFDIAVLLFVIVQLFIPIIYPAKAYLLCWIGWESVGNSNWFIFDILALYLIAQIALLVQDSYGHGGIVITLLATAGLWLALRIAGKPSWWMDTILAFPLGMIFSHYKTRVDRLLEKRGLPYCLFALLLLLFISLHLQWGNDLYGGAACLFCCLVTVTSSFVCINNPGLAWLGKNAFTIYIIQRLPMIVLTATGLNSNRICVLCMLPATDAFDGRRFIQIIRLDRQAVVQCLTI